MSYSPNLTIANLLAASAERNPDAPALLAPGRKPLSYKRLYAQIEETVYALNAMGIGREDRVGLVISDGPELALAFLAIASGATAITLNPNYTRAEFETFFTRMKIKALVYQSQIAEAALAAANACNLKLIALETAPETETGLFVLQGEPSTPPKITGFAQPGDIGLVATTSGTTGLAKLIPETQSLYCLRALIPLSVIPSQPDDRLLNIMPLFHTAGMNHVFRSLVAGSSVVCLPGFEVASFYQALDTFRPTWFSAVSTLCQAIIAQAGNYESITAHHSLRHIRAGSMALPPAVMVEMERIFKVPVLQVYSSTESNIIATNRLPPHIRKIGSVGMPLLTVAVVDDHMTRQPTGQAGEIIVQGPTVFAGYEDDPQATAQVLVDGWYRTGDLGYLDEDGHLFISGRIKDVINRGGQKLSPNEVETVLLEHPAVKAAAVFGIPDLQLGEDVAAAVVIQADHNSSNGAISDIQAFVAQHLVAYKLPRQIIVVDEIPLTAIGKIDRKRLAGLLSLAVADGDIKTDPPQQESSRTKTESDLVRLWAEVLKIPETAIGLHDSFQSLGGVSLSAVRLVFKVRSTFGINLSIIDFFNAPTIAIQSEIVNQFLQRGTTGNPPSSLIPIKPGGSRAPLYCLHALKGAVYLYRAFIPFLDPEQPIYGLQAIGLDDGQTPVDNVDSMVDYHIQQIKAVQLKGPYFLCGFSFGGRLALEVGRRLRAEGHRDVYVLMIDDHLSASQFLKQFSFQRRLDKMGISRLASLRFGLLRLPGHYRNLYIRQKIEELWHYTQKKPRMSRKPDWMLEEDDLLPEPISAIKEASKRAALSYTLRPYEGPVVYLRAANDDINIILFRALKYMAKGPFSLIDVPGVHSSLMTDPAHVQRVACEIQQWLNAANQAQPAE